MSVDVEADLYAWAPSAPAARTARPVFLHGMWRSGSTYVWSKFRAAEHTRCFFEPLIEGLARLTPERIWRDTSNVATNRHPPLDLPYFHEFTPFIVGRGVEHYQRDFATKRFVMGADERHPALERYIGSLVQAAQNEGRTAVLGFNRTGLRLPWLTQRFDAYHVQIERDPRSIWASYMERLAHGDSTFLARWLILAERNRNAPPFSALAERLPLRRSVLAHLRRPKAYYADALATLSIEESYLLVCTIWLATTLQALTYCDEIIDINQANNAAYKANLGARLRENTGLGVDLCDMRAIAPATPVVPAKMRALERQAIELFPKEAFAPFYDADICRARLSELAPRKAERLAQLL